MKKSIVLFVFIVLLVSGAYAQSIVPRTGIYMMQGSEDMVVISNIQYYSTNFAMSWYIGSDFNNPIFKSAGSMSGNNLIVTTYWFNDAYLRAILVPNHGVKIGDRVTYRFANATMFVDENGQTWTWRRTP